MWTMPPQELLQQISSGQNPYQTGTQAATSTITSAQGQQAPGMTPTGMPSPDQGYATQLGASGRNNPNGGTGNGAQPANPGNYGTGSYAYNSPQWYGKGNEYGTSVMARSPFAFWGGYAEDQMGLAPGSQASSFLSSKYNPMAMGAAMYGKGFTSDDQILAGSTAIANQIAGPGTTFFSPGALIQNTLQALSSGNVEQLMKQNPVLANLVLSSQGDPIGQVSALTDFLKEALSATMPPDVLSAFINQIQALGQVWFSQMRKDPNMNAMDASTFAKFLIQNYGPTLGL